MREVYSRDGGFRLVLPFLDTIPTNGEKPKMAEDGVSEVEYNYIPEKAPSKDVQNELELAYKSNSLSETGNIYTTDGKPNNSIGPFLAKRNKEYEYNGKRYVRAKANSSYEGYFTLSNGEKYKNGDYVWVEVMPIKWWIDEKAKLMVTGKLVLSGVPFEGLVYSSFYIDRCDYKIEYFDETIIKRFMDKYLYREICQKGGIQYLPEIEEKNEEREESEKNAIGQEDEEDEKEQEDEENIREQEEIEVEEAEEDFYIEPKRSRLERLNPDKTEQSKREKITYTELISNWLNSGESVLLRGPSGIGKTERIKELCPNLIYLKLTDNIFPEKVVGSFNFQTGENIPPNYAKTAIMQAANEEERKLIKENIQSIYNIADEVYKRSKESDKKIVLLLDELLNVKQGVQSLVFTLILDRMVEIGSGLKLPKNVVIVATGNPKKYSSVAHDLAEPLAKRFNHILDMEPRVGEWITDYAIPHNIHPSVLGYILSKYNSTGRSEEIKDMGYFYEEPEVGERHLDKYGQKGKTNDPRGWSQISEMLYNFENNLKKGKYKGKDVEDILKKSLESKLRIEWANEFFDYYNLCTLTPAEVVRGMGKGYTYEDLPQNINERFAYMTALVSANEEQIESCREFIRRYCDSEYLAIYDMYWAGNNEKRMEQIAELQGLTMLNLHKGDEASEYAERGILAYKKIGQRYNKYRGKGQSNIGEYENIKQRGAK